MLYFEMRPDPVFHRLVRESLEWVSANLENQGEGSINIFSKKTKEIFSARELLPVVNTLLKAHKSDRLFTLTEYHYLILYEALADVVHKHNKGEGEWLSGLRVEHIDFDALIDIYFWNDDFLYTADMFDAIPEEEKQQTGFADETYGVVHHLKPHPNQIELKEIKEINKILEEWQIPTIYRMEEVYPFFGDTDIW